MNTPENPICLVTSALRGRLPDNSEWPRLLEVANRAWLGPALFVALERAALLEDIPDPVRDYLELLHDRNLERNRRLRAQLIEAVGALNASGIEPVLLKGAIALFCASETRVRCRMISDLDINVAPAQGSATKAALLELGYREMANPREFGRSSDVGVIELHFTPHVRSTRYLSGEFGTSAPALERHLVKARVPTATAQAAHLIVHDMIKEGDYWQFRFNLRHLDDLAALATSGEGIDWHCVSETLFDRPGRAALAMQLYALRELFGVDSPPELSGGLMNKVSHAARLQAVRKNITGSAVRFIGKLLWGLHLFAQSYERKGATNFARRLRSRMSASPKGSTL